MRIIHRVSINSSPEKSAELASIGVVVAASGFVSFDFEESDPAWPTLQSWIIEHDAVDVATTKFTKQEITSARWLELQPDWHCGYPQPRERDFGYREATYDTSGYCEACGTGLRQKAPFQMKAEPNWRRYSILQLNWVFDEYFVTPEVWSRIFRPRGIGRRPVLDTRQTELKTVVQLIVEEQIDICTEGLVAQKCTRCGTVKYVPHSRGPFPALVTTPTGHMSKTKQYFGSGASAAKRVLVSHELAGALMSENVRGASVRPVTDQCTRPHPPR